MDCPNCEFTRTLTFDERKKEAEKIKAKYPDRVPTIVIRNKNSDFPKLESSKFLVPKELTVGHFIYVLRTKIKLRPEQAIFVFVNGVLPPNTQLMSLLHEKNVSRDGFLYLTVASENTFGF